MTTKVAAVHTFGGQLAWVIGGQSGWQTTGVQTKLLKGGAKTGLITTRQRTGRLDKPNKVKTAVGIEWTASGSHVDMSVLGHTTSENKPPDAYVSTDSIALIKNDQASDLPHGHDSHEAVMEV